MYRTAGTFLATLLVGCAATGPTYQAASSPSSDAALIYIYRPDSLTYGARAAHFFVDDKSVANVNSNGYSYFYITPGSYRLRQKWPGLLSDSGDDRELNIPISVNAGSTYFYRFETWSSDNLFTYNGITYKQNWRLSEVTPSQAQSQIVETKFQPAKLQVVR